MSFLYSTYETETRTVFPAHVSRATALAALHNHSLMMTVNPLIISHHQINTDSPGASSKYSITDRIHFLPYNLWPSCVVYTGEFTDTENGVDVLVNAPMGFESRSRWSVEVSAVGDQGQAEEVGEEQRPVLVESSTIRCSMFLMPFVKATTEKSHKQLHKTLMERLE